MLAVTHLIVSLLLIQLFLLDRNDAFVALAFGVFIDLDHLMGLKDYAETKGIKALFDVHNLLNPDGHWKSMLHNPIALGIVGPLSVASRLAIPLIFWGVHISMDIVQDTFLGQFSQAEGMLIFFSALALVTIRYSKYVESAIYGTFTQYFKAELSVLRHMFPVNSGF